MATINVINLKISAYVPVGETIEEQFATLKLAAEAAESGDYSALLAKGVILKVGSELNRRRVGDTPEEATQADIEDVINGSDEAASVLDMPGDEEVPEFLKKAEEAKALRKASRAA